MRRHLTVLLLLVLIAAPSAADKPALSPKEQKAFLDSRRRSGMMLGLFNGFISLLYAAEDVQVTCKDKDALYTPLESPFFDFYKPTWCEFFDAIARQTGTSWHYLGKGNHWKFTKPAPPLPYTLKLAPDWTVEPHGSEVNYRPKVQPVGMDIYIMGRYSADKKPDAEKLFTKVRESLAILWAQRINEKAQLKDMKKTKVDGVDALYWESPAPVPQVTWRQWVFVKDGRAFAIVSAIEKDNEEKLLPQVKTMVASFRVTSDKPAPKPETKDRKDKKDTR